MIRNTKLAVGVLLGLCFALVVTSYVLVTFIQETWPVVEYMEVQVIDKEAFLVVTINSGIVGVIFVIGFVMATLFIFGCYFIVDRLYPIKRFVLVQK